MLVVAVFNLWGYIQTVDSMHVIELNFENLKRKPVKFSYFNILNGRKAKDAKEALIIPSIVVIDNNTHPSTRAGLTDADFVFEVPLEGGQTRFLAFFDPEIQVTKIGPVRSIRPYMIDFASELGGGVLAHAGGSPYALLELQQGVDTILNLDEIGPNGKYFWRSRDDLPPHNLFTSSQLLSNALASVFKANTVVDTGDDALEKRYKEKQWTFFDEDKPATSFYTIEHPSVIIDYSTFRYEIEYRYDKEIGGYIRYEGDLPARTFESKKIIVHNLLIAFMKIEVLDSEGRLKIENVPEGEAIVCQQGVCKKGLWKKPSRASRIRFFVNPVTTGLRPRLSGNGIKENKKSVLLTDSWKEVIFIPGKTWVQIVPLGRRVVY